MFFSNATRISFFLLFIASSVFGQIIPVSLDSRIDNSEVIAKVKLEEKISYRDINQTGIFTLNRFQVIAYLKGKETQTEIAIITHGGQIDNVAQITYPETNFQKETEYLVFLEKQDLLFDFKSYRNLFPSLKQYHSVAPIQGAIPFVAGKYKDALSEKPQTEKDFFAKIEKKVQQKPRLPDGKIYYPVTFENTIGKKMAVAITDVRDGLNNTGPFYSGTIDSNDEMVITGTGFEAMRNNGYVGFTNADDGGATYVTPANASDYLSWSNTQIRVKIPSRAGSDGTHTIIVENNSGDSDTYTIDEVSWAMNHVNNSFYFWGSDHRNRLELVDDDGNGGYTFQYSSNGGMSSNSDAKDAFSRAMSTWRCDSGVNFEISNTTTGVGLTDDDINVVMFANLGGGTLGRATSRYTASGTGSCDKEDTFWRVKEIDIQFSNSHSWYYGNGSCSGTTYDFESTALHEIGHGHGLGHVINPSKVMHYASGTCSGLTTLSAAESDAGAHKMNHSTASNCISSPPPMTEVPSGSCDLLPVELISFSGQFTNQVTRLEWKTGSEINNSGFEVQQKTYGKDWVSIGFEKGNGTSYDSHIYSFIDNNPRPGLNYYRLKQLDFSGEFEFSEAIAIDVDISDYSDIQIFPNPITGNVEVVNVHIPVEETVIATFFNLLGEPVSSHRLSENERVLPISDLTNGIYYLRLETKRKQFLKKIIKN